MALRAKYLTSERQLAERPPMERRCPNCKDLLTRHRGFTYLVALFALAILSVLTTRALEESRTALQREKEAELLYAGQAYLNAIRLYYDSSPGTVRRYPPNLESLLLDERSVRIRRPLRRMYRDPMTASTEWGVIESSDGGIKGVYSRSQGVPIKRAGFPGELRNFEVANHYDEWKFVHETK